MINKSLYLSVFTFLSSFSTFFLPKSSYKLKNFVDVPDSGYRIGQKVKVTSLDCEDNIIVSYGVIVGKVYGHPEWLVSPLKDVWVYYVRFYPLDVVKGLSRLNLEYDDIDLIPHDEVELLDW